MQPAITSEVVGAYAQCPRKAYLLLFNPEQSQPHEYVGMVDRQQRENQKRYMDLLQHHHADVHPYTMDTCATEPIFFSMRGSRLRDMRLSVAFCAEERGKRVEETLITNPQCAWAPPA